MSKKKYYDHLQAALKLHPIKDVVSIVGAGGKTSALIRLAKELALIKKRVIVTTTTHLTQNSYDLIRYSGDLDHRLIENIETRILDSPAVIAKRMVKGGQIKGISPEQVLKINREVTFDYMLVKADSSAQKSLKANNRYEPPVPLCTTLFLVIIGFDTIGKKINLKNVHRPQIVARILDKPLESHIQPSDIITLLRHPLGLLKNRPPATRTAIILNKVGDHNMKEAVNLAEAIIKYGQGINSVICGDIGRLHQLLLFT